MPALVDTPHEDYCPFVVLEGVAMKVPLTVGDFLDRAALVFRDRTAIVDEPGADASLGALTYGQLEAKARGMALALEQMGIDQNERVALVSPNSARFLISFYGVSAYGRVLVPINFRLLEDEVQYIVDHSGASVLLVDPELDEALDECHGEGAHSPRRAGRPCPVRRGGAGPLPASLGGRRGQSCQYQLHQRYDGPSQGCPVDPSQLLAQRRHFRLACNRHGPGCLPPRPSNVPLQRLGHAVRRYGHGLQTGRPAQSGRRRDLAPGW